MTDILQIAALSPVPLLWLAYMGAQAFETIRIFNDTSAVYEERINYETK